MTIEGVDYASSKPSTSALVAAGKHFACRYGGPGRVSKQITASEANSLQNAEIAIVSNAEGAAGGFTGRAAGISWAQQALDHFTPLGMPKDRPIYFSVDWDAGSADWPGIDAAFGGAADVLGGVHRVGVYGGYHTIAHCVTSGIASWFWQTYAWSLWTNPQTGKKETRWHPKDHIQQYHNGVTIDGADCDLDRAMFTDYGQWGVKDMPLSNADVNTIFNTDGVVTAPANSQKDQFWTGGQFLRNGYNEAAAAHASAEKANAAVVALTAQVTELSKQVADLKATPAVVTPEELQAALVAALKQWATS